MSPLDVQLVGIHPPQYSWQEINCFRNANLYWAVAFATGLCEGTVRPFFGNDKSRCFAADVSDGWTVAFLPVCASFVLLPVVFDTLKKKLLLLLIYS
ncbi:hypothetical protein AVEN_117400-1 [Araneus ventricosus]|uniref:Uncharacterized protein n=1 Tax=Araneus ventricosus TaxID=182803 RepID=A0A4Y2E3H5_ARAVE|nr:hypothetical protein AVEN_117400-1 [Araneus ventricosus]